MTGTHGLERFADIVRALGCESDSLECPDRVLYEISDSDEDRDEAKGAPE